MPENASDLGTPPRAGGSRGFGIMAKLAALSLAMVLFCAVILLIASRGLDRLTDSIDAVQSVQGSYLQKAYDLREQCESIQLFIYTQATQVYAGEKNVGRASGGVMKTMTDASRTTLAALRDVRGLSLDQGMMKSLGESYDSYTTLLPGIEQAFDAGKGEATRYVQASEDAYRSLNSQVENLLSSVRAAGDDAAAKAHRLAGLTSLTLMLVISGAVLLCIAFSIFIIRSISRPLGGLVAAVERTATGDLRGDTGLSGRDELGRIAASLDGLVAQLRSLVATVKERLALLESTGGELTAMMAGTGDAVGTIADSVASTMVQLESQTAAVQGVSAAIEELTSSIDGLSSMISNHASVIAQSSAAVEEMISNIESMTSAAQSTASAALALVEESRQGKSRIDGVSGAVAEIVRQSENLGEAASLVTQIAQRTNLLAMNAAIEAAHAGDAGRGFAVVADEIRKLAEQSSAQGKDISAELGKVSSSIEAVRAAASDAVDSFASILGKSSAVGDEASAMGAAMAEQREGGRQVLEGLERLRDITREIERGSGEMSKGNAAILEQVQRLTEANGYVLRDTSRIKDGASEIERAVAGTTELSSRNARDIAEVRSAMDKFSI